MVQDNPRSEELELLAKFCKKYPYIYIYGHDAPQRLIAKYLVMSGIPMAGFIVPEVRPEDYINEWQPVQSVVSLLKIKRKKVGVLLPIEDIRYTEAVSMLHQVGVENIFFFSEWNKRTIPFKMTPRCVENLGLEVNLADHCNLNCQCCDHFSPIAEPTFLDFDQYVRDMQRLADLTGHKIGLIKLEGGEPLLNEHLIDYIRVTRDIFPDSHICIFTNGLLLNKWGKKEGDQNLWKAVKECEIEVCITIYPIPLDLETVRTQAEQWGIPFTTDQPMSGNEARVSCFANFGNPAFRGLKYSVKFPLDLSGQQEAYRFISCHQFNECIALRDGRIYTCPMIPYAHHFNKYFGENLEVTEQDSIDIYQVKSFEEIAEFCTHRAPFCRYCAVHCRSARDWKQSEHTRDEWVL